MGSLREDSKESYLQLHKNLKEFIKICEKEEHYTISKPIQIKLLKIYLDLQKIGKLLKNTENNEYKDRIG